jgi:hypothetical protein
MAENRITAEDRKRYARAREVGERELRDPSAVVEARYLRNKDAVELVFSGGGLMRIPRQAISELADAPVSALRSVIISPAGDSIAWRTLDVDIYVPGLVERVFGTRMLAAASGRRGGRRTSRAKAIAARANGAKGGRPRKALAT